MQSDDEVVLRHALASLQAGHRTGLITVAQTWGAAPRPAGSLMAVAEDGGFAGSVSGGCVEADLLERAAGKGLWPAVPEVLEYGVGADDAERYGLPCGGRLRLVVEGLEDPAALTPVMESLARRQRLGRRLHLADGRAELRPADRASPFHFDGRVLEKVFGPAWRLVLIGAGQLSHQVAEMALAADYEVIVCDPRAEYARQWQVPGAHLDPRMPDEVVAECAADPQSGVVTLTHDPRLDDMALLEALESPAFYVGALGSRRTNARRRERLTELGIGPDGLARLRGPVGLPLGGRTPAEIALSILAEVTAVRHGAALGRAPEGMARV